MIPQSNLFTGGASKKPFLDNKGTLGIFLNNEVHNKSSNDSKISELELQVSCNRKRSNRVSACKRKNWELTKQLTPMLTSDSLDQNRREYLFKLHKNLNSCASISLYREHKNNGAIDYIGSHTCDHKLCFVCNSIRQKRVRRKYMLFFEQNRTVNLIQNNKSGSIRAITDSKLLKMKTDGKMVNDYSFLSSEGYDLMHLTLTLPHYKESGFRGEKYYYDELIRMFNFLRKNKQWNHFVYGGEYGIETTNTESGLNIHIHALLLVKKEFQNRNKLHKIVLKAWNKLTVNPYSTREELSERTLKKICKSNQLIDLEYALKLHPKGATIVTLENIYNYNENGDKERVASDKQKILKAVAEAISYHFEPQCFDKDSGEIDVDLMLDIMPILEGKPLYRKFGCLHGEKSLNIKVPKEEQAEEDFAESGAKTVINPITFSQATRDDYEFFICNPSHLYHIKEENLKPVTSRSAVKYYLDDAPDTLVALNLMSFLALQRMYKGSTDFKKRFPDVDFVTALCAKYDPSLLHKPEPTFKDIYW